MFDPTTEKMHKHRRVPFAPENKPKPLVPIRCPFPEHDRGGMPLRFGLGQDKDRELQAKIIKDMKIGDVNAFVDEASRVDAPLSARDKVDGAKKGRAGGVAKGGDDGGSLVTAMAGRLRHAEEAAIALREEVKKKDQTIQQLRIELSKAIRGNGAGAGTDEPAAARAPSGGGAAAGGGGGGAVDVAMLQESNSKLREMLRRADAEATKAQRENGEMKKFLKDYGMTWVGAQERDGAGGGGGSGRSSGSSSPDGGGGGKEKRSPQKDGSPPQKEKRAGKELLMNGGDWVMPGKEGGEGDLNARGGVESLGTDFDPAQIMSNVKKLNHVAGEGQKEVVMGADGIRRLREKCTVGYIFYKDGIFARGGPLRPYGVRESKVLVRDLMDGYFPWELKDEYPEGVPLKVEMRLDQALRGGGGASAFKAFRGEGQALGDEAKGEGAHAAGPAPGGGAAGREVWAPGGGEGRGTALFRKLPERVVKNGEVIEVKSDIQRMLGVAPPPASAGSAGPGAGGVRVESVDTGEGGREGVEVATLRIKTPGGERVLELRLPFTATVGEVHERVGEHMGGGKRYRIRSSFPAREYGDDAATLEEAGLTPNALLLLVDA